MKAGFLLVGSATKDDARVVSVVMGAPTEAARDRDSVKLLRFGRAFFKPVEPVSSGRTITELPVALQDVTAPVYAKRDVRFALRDGERYARQRHVGRRARGPARRGHARRHGQGHAQRPRGDRVAGRSCAGRCPSRRSPRCCSDLLQRILPCDPASGDRVYDWPAADAAPRAPQSEGDRTLSGTRNRTMIITVTLNAAIDKYARGAAASASGAAIAPSSRRTMPGGKGVNVARA